MKIAYLISKKLQRELAGQGIEAHNSRTCEITNTDISEIIRVDERITIQSDGRLNMNLINTRSTVDYDFRDDRRVYCLRSGHNMYFDFLIEDAASLKRALNEIAMQKQAIENEVMAKQAAYDREVAEKKALAEQEKLAHEEIEPPRTDLESEAEPDPFEAYRHLDGLELMLQHGRERQAKRIVLDFLEAEFAQKMQERGFEILDTSDLACTALDHYHDDIPVDALRELVKLADIDGVPYVYHEDYDPHIGLDVTIRFAGVYRTVVVNVFSWDN